MQHPNCRRRLRLVRHAQLGELPEEAVPAYLDGELVEVESMDSSDDSSESTSATEECDTSVDTDESDIDDFIRE